VPAHNSEDHIARAIDSILRQSRPPDELIVVDDGSTDKTGEIARSYGADVIYVRQKNAGPGAARNRGIETASCEWIAFLDSDDMWHHQKLEKQVAFMLEKDIYVSNTNFLHMDEDGMFLGIRIKARPSVTYKKLLCNNYIGNLTGMYNAKHLGKIYSPDIKKRQDWALWLEAIEKGGKPCMGLQEDLGFYRIREKSLSSNKFNLVIHNFIFYNKGLGYSKLGALYRMGRFFWEYFLFRPKFVERFKVVK